MPVAHVARKRQPSTYAACRLRSCTVVTSAYHAKVQDEEGRGYPSNFPQRIQGIHPVCSQMQVNACTHSCWLAVGFSYSRKATFE